MMPISAALILQIGTSLFISLSFLVKSTDILFGHVPLHQQYVSSITTHEVKLPTLDLLGPILGQNVGNLSGPVSELYTSFISMQLFVRFRNFQLV